MPCIYKLDGRKNVDECVAEKLIFLNLHLPDATLSHISRQDFRMIDRGSMWMWVTYKDRIRLENRFLV